MRYPVLLGEDPVGTAEAVRQGLYYRITCRCVLTGEVMYQVTARGESGEENLGLLVPEGEAFCLTTRVPAKRLPGQTLSFRAVPRGTERKTFFAPIYPEEPFAYISRLKEAFLERRGGQVGVRIPQETGPQDSDPSL